MRYLGANAASSIARLTSDSGLGELRLQALSRGGGGSTCIGIRTTVRFSDGGDDARQMVDMAAREANKDSSI